MSFTSGQVLTAAALNDLDIDSLTLTDATPVLTLKDSNSTGTSNFAIKFTDSADTDLARIYGGGGNDIRFEVAGSDHTIMSDSGRMGIGNTSPQAPLHVTRDDGSSEVLRLENDAGENEGPYIGLYDLNSRLGYLGFPDNDDLHVKNESSSGLIYFSTNNTTRMAIEAGGEVGIGTSTPSAKLHVNAGTVNNVATFESTDTGAILSLKDDTTTGNSYVGIRADGNQLSLRAGNSNRVIVTSSGVLQWVVSSGVGGPLTDTSTTSGYRYVLQNQTFGTLYDYTSVRDRKDQITNVTAEDSGRWIDALQPVTYIERWMGEGDEPDDAREWREADMQVGFIADDILANADTDHFSQVLDNGEGGLDPAGWKWECVIAAAVAEIKSLRARVATLEA